MINLTLRDVLKIIGVGAALCLVYQGWGNIIGFLGIVLTAIAPLVLGACIAYVAAIPTRFFERHTLPDSDSTLVANLRRPVCLVVTIILVVGGMVLSSALLAPALVETVVMVQQNGEQFVEDIIQQPAMEPIRETVHNFITGDFIQSLKRLDIQGVVNMVFSGTMGSITTQVFTMVSTVMTGFFGLLFSFILLTDTTDIGNKVMRVVAEYLGQKRTEQLALMCGVADSSFHNFIVRQCIEAAILGSVGTTVLVLSGFPYALGVGALMGLAALVPIVGYPIGLFLGAFMVAINNVWIALLYVACVAVAQVLEATFLLPHIGDPRTALPPVWVTVAVTIGGGVAGFVGMLIAIPVASTIRQLILIDIRRRQRAAGTLE